MRFIEARLAQGHGEVVPAFRLVPDIAQQAFSQAPDGRCKELLGFRSEGCHQSLPNPHAITLVQQGPDAFFEFAKYGVKLLPALNFPTPDVHLDFHDFLLG